VELNTSTRITTAAVREICDLKDDLYRLRWVSYAYDDLARRLDPKLGGNASWPAFARWSAFTISEALRLDQVNPRLEDVLRRHALPQRVTGPLVEIQKRLRSLDDGAMPTILALGNRFVFHEVGWTVAEFLEWLETQDGPDPDKWNDYQTRITPFAATDFFRPGYLEWLRDGVRAYYDACWERDPRKQAQHVLRGNMLIGAYEQWRVDSFFEVALDFNPGNLIERLRIDDHDDLAHRLIGVRHAGTRRALRHQWAMLNWMADAYAALLTRFVLTWDAPLYGPLPSAVRLGCNLPARQAPAPQSEDLAELDGDTKRLFEAFDRSGGELRGAGARNWRHFGDRMSFIVNLFRTQQQNPHLRVPPTFEDRRLLELRITDEHLEGLRNVGDDIVDALLERRLGDQAFDVAVVRDFIASGRPHQLVRDEQLTIEYPDWVNPEQLRRGQEFFEENKLAIASAFFCASLPKAYTGAKGARVLMSTAELVSDTRRRISETGRLLLDVMMPDPNGLRPGTRGHDAVLTVRSYHAAVRLMLREQEPWRSHWKEVPINQEDLLGTLTTFTVVVIEALETMGIEVSEESRDAYIHTWLVAGHLLGIDYDRLRGRPFNRNLEPLSYFELQLLRDAIFRRQAAPSASGQLLTHALINMQENALPLALRPLPPAAIRRFLGDDAADMLEVPPAGPVRVLLGAFGPAGASAGLMKHGRLMQPRLADMTHEMFRQ